MKKYLQNIIIYALTSIIFLSLSCKEYEFTSPYDQNNTVAAPTGLNVTFLGDTAVTIRWNYSFVQNVNYTFDIEISEDGTNFSILKAIKENITVVSVGRPFTAEKQYHFRVRSIADNNASAFIKTTGKFTFPAPGNFQVNFQADTAVVFNWTKASTLEKSFVIEQSIDGEAYSVIGTPGINQTSFRYDNALLLGHIYKYRLKALSANNTSPYSAEVTKVVTFDAPGNVTVQLPTDTSAVVSWVDNSTIETGFDIEQSEDGVNYVQVGESGAGISIATIYRDYFEGKTYTFRVKAKSRNNIATSVPSAGVSIQLPAPVNLMPTLNADTSVTLLWSSTSVYTRSFEILLSVDGGQMNVVKEVLYNQVQTTYDYDFRLNHTYKFGIRAKSKNNVSQITESDNIAVVFNPPGNVTAQLPTDTVAIIQWQDNSTIVMGYDIYLSLDGGNSIFIKELPPNTTQTEYISDYYTGHTYTFSLRGKSARNGETSFASGSAVFNLMQLSGLKVDIPNNTTANLSWVNGSGYAREIVIEESQDGINYTFVKSVTPTVTTTSVSGTYQTNITYYFRIRTNTKNNIGNYSINSSLGFFCGASTITYSGKTYNTVKIGSQCWLKENLDVGTMIQGSASPSNNGTIEKYCYGNNTANCSTYGGIYTWKEAMQYSTVAGSRGICPEGWHIPTNAEFQTLGSSVSNNSNALKAVGQGTGGGAGTNTSGFSALLAGGRSSNGYFYDLSGGATFWNSTEYSAIYARTIYLNYIGSNIYFDYYDKEYGFSLRCAKDSN